MRIVSLAPSNTDILIALGLGKEIVGVDDWSDLPAGSGVTRLGGETSIDLEKVADLHPDMVVSSLSVPGMEGVVEGIKRLGLRQIILDPETLDEVYAGIFEAGLLLGKGEEALRVVEDMHETANRIREKTLRIKDLPRVYFEWWPDPLMTPGRRNWVTDMIEIAGGINIYGLIDERTVKPSPDDVVSKRPDVIILCWCGELNAKMDIHSVRERPGWKEIPAVKNGRVYTLDERVAGRPGPRLKEGMMQTFKFLHPDLCGGDINLKDIDRYG